MPRVIIPKTFDAWIAGAMATTGRKISSKAQWEEAGERFFDYTQLFVHVFKGPLKESGRFALNATGNQTTVAITYGNANVRYAQTEIDRGPEHDFMGRAWEASQRGFEETFAGTWDRVVESWQVI